MTHVNISRKLTDGGDEKAQFKYKKLFDWHFCEWHIVIADDHNNLQHASHSLKKA